MGKMMKKLNKPFYETGSWYGGLVSCYANGQIS